MLKTLEKAKRAVRIIFWAVLFVVVLVGIIAGWERVGRWLTAIAGGLMILFGGRISQERNNEKKQEINEKEKALVQIAAERQKQAETVVREDEKQQRAVEDWRKRKNRWKSPGSLILILCMLLIAASPARAEEKPYADLTREELIERLIEAEKLLDEADQLLTREMALKEEYRQLYIEAEANLHLARELSAEKNEIITTQGKEIDYLRYRLDRQNQAWGLTGRVALTRKGPQWSLGVVRKKGIISIGAGIGGGDSFSLWGEVGFWVR